MLVRKTAGANVKFRALLQTPRGTGLCAAHSLLLRVTRWSTLKAWGTAIAKWRGLRRVTVAVACRLAVILHRMWTDGCEFRWCREETSVVIFELLGNVRYGATLCENVRQWRGLRKNFYRTGLAGRTTASLFV
jgi:hypothetical protein